MPNLQNTILRLLPAKGMRLAMNIWPPLVGAGIFIEHIADDYSEVRVRMSLHWFNTNYVGTHFGGSIYSMTDPFFMLMVMRRLGNEFIVWDKAADIQFKNPGRGVVRAVFRLDDETLRALEHDAHTLKKVEPTFTVEVRDEDDRLVAVVHKTLYVRMKRAGDFRERYRKAG